MVEVELKYSYVENKMSILINNQVLQSTSRLRQYMSEPFYIWAPEIFSVLNDIVGCEFTVYYIGRIEEYRTLSSLAKNINNKINIIYKAPIVTMSIQERMKALGEYIKKNTNLRCKKIERDIYFLGDTKLLNKYREKIDALQVENAYCKFRFKTSKTLDNTNGNNEVYIYLTKNINEISAEFHKARQFCRFILLESQSSEDVYLYRDMYTYTFLEENFFENIFEILILFSLGSVLRESIYNIINNNSLKLKEKIFLESLLKDEPICDIYAKSNIEIDEFVAWKISIYPKVAYLPDLLFECSDLGIVECSAKGVKGLREGRTNVRIYQKGNLTLLKELNFLVYKRNRIISILFADNKLTLGMGEEYRMKVSFIPADADNMDKVRWSSNNTSVADVDKDGLIKAKKYGSCIITCEAENAKETCEIVCKPYLEDIEIANVNNGILYLTKGDVFVLEIKRNPVDSIDGKITVVSNDLFLINADGCKLTALDCGKTTVIISNSSRTICKKIKVIVSLKEESIKFNIKNNIAKFLGV